jgi:hypothetical protein
MELKSETYEFVLPKETTLRFYEKLLLDNIGKFYFK